MLKLCHHKDGCRDLPKGCEACFQCRDITMSGLVAAGLTPRIWSRSQDPRDLLQTDDGFVPTLVHQIIAKANRR